MVEYNTITEEIKSAIATIVGDAYLSDKKDLLEHHASDATEDLVFMPEVVVKPANTEEVAAILRIASANNISVTPQGATTGLAGGALPVCGGIALSMERFDKVIDIDTENLQVTVEPGVITQVLQEAVAEVGLFYPPDPSSRGISFIGGNVATNAGGPKAVKYGVVKDYVLNLEVVLASGEVIWTGANTLKNSTGYNLTQLFVGSEGTLGIITKIVLKLIPMPSYNLLLMASFRDPLKACEAVSAIFRAGITPSALEFMERDALEWAKKYLGDSSIKVEEGTEAQLLIEVDGNYEETLYHDCEKITEVLERYEVGEILFADSEEQKNTLWELRRNVGHAVKTNSIYKEEDTVVPRASLAKLLKKVKDIGEKYGFESVCYGHAGDGNLHVNIIKGQLSDFVWNEQLPIWITEIFEEVKTLGGTISGEHGIGFVQKRYLPIVFSETELLLMRQIKKVFDSCNILNPNKIVS